MPIAPEELRMLGNSDLLSLPKTAFFCSRHFPVGTERGTYLWALEQRYRGHCILSGFHSRQEQVIFRYLLQGPKQPIIYALGRGIQSSVGLEYGPEIAAGRLLFISLFEPDIYSITQETANLRNQLVAELADQFFIPYMTPGGNVEHLLQSPSAQGKPIFTLGLPENSLLLERGAQVFRPGGVFGRQQ